MPKKDDSKIKLKLAKALEKRMRMRSKALKLQRATKSTQEGLKDSGMKPHERSAVRSDIQKQAYADFEKTRKKILGR